MGTTASFAASGASNGATTKTTSAIEISTATSRNIKIRDYALDLNLRIADNPSPPAPLPQGERGVVSKPTDFFAPWRLCVRICVKCIIAQNYRGQGRTNPCQSL